MNLDLINPDVKADIMNRLKKLTPESKALWGKMNVSQMLAHCNVAYEMAFTDKHPKPNALMRFILKSFVKNGVVNETPYKKNIKTAPQFIITGRKNFEEEKARLINYLEHTCKLGRDHFEGKESLSFGPMTSTEWNNQFYKHLDHHLTQFGV